MGGTVQNIQIKSSSGGGDCGETDRVAIRYMSG